MEISKEENSLKIVLGILAIVFLVTDLVLVFATPLLFNLINISAELIGAGKTPFQLRNSILLLQTSMMLMITYISYMVWKDVKKNLNMVPVLMLSKIVSSASGLLLFFFSARYFAYLVLAITDFPLFVIVYILYKRVRR